MLKTWLDFEEEIIHRNRFFPNADIIRQVDELLGNPESSFVIEKGRRLYRARQIALKDIKYSNGEISGYDGKDSLSPSSDITIAGRANPSKIPYLYAAMDEYTAAAEIKPSLKDFISIAELKAETDLRLADFIYREEQSAQNDLEQLRSNISLSYSVVVDKRNSEGYIPTQYIAEYIKHKGLDGIAYMSLQAYGGINIAIFDQRKVSYLRSKVFQTCSINYNIIEISGKKEANTLRLPGSQAEWTREQLEGVIKSIAGNIPEKSTGNK